MLIVPNPLGGLSCSLNLVNSDMDTGSCSSSNNAASGAGIKASNKTQAKNGVSNIKVEGMINILLWIAQYKCIWCKFCC